MSASSGPQEWKHFDHLKTSVEVRSWAELRAVFEADMELAGHGQITVRLGGDLRGVAMDVATYLEQMLGQSKRVLDLGDGELLVTRRPLLRPFGTDGNESGDRYPRRPYPPTTSGTIAAPIPESND